MSKKFEYVDDNPGSYFGMLVESVEDKKESLKEDKKETLKESRTVDYLELDLAEKSGDEDVYNAYDENELTIVKDGNVWYFEHCPNGLDKKVKKLMKKYYPELTYLYESLKEDKFVSRDKMSKKDQKELNDKKRGTWGNTSPVTRVQPNKKAYDRKRDKKVVDESKQLNEVRDFEWEQELWAVVKDNGNFAGNPCLSWEEAREISANHEGSKIYEMTLDRDQINESVSKKDLYDALKDAYGMTKKEADKWIKDASEKSKEEIVKGFKSNAKKSFKYD